MGAPPATPPQDGTVHIPDGFLDTATCVASAAGAAAAVATALGRCRAELSERATPLAGLVAAFVFAAQMVNFPVAAGTSGHVVGAALAVALVGPWTAMLCLTVVLVVQCLLFADGGITALGANVLTMAVVAVLTAWAVQVLVQWLVQHLVRGRHGVVVACAASGLASVVVAAAAFSGLFAVGGTVDVPAGTVFAAMVGVHTLIGLGEAVVTALVVGAVMALRPDLVHAGRRSRHELVPVVREPAEVGA